MSEDSHPLNHADRRQIVLHEIRSAQVQNIQTPDSIEFLLRRMQPRDWPGTFRDMSAVAAQIHRVTQTRLPNGLRDRIALSLLVFPRGDRWQQQVCCTHAAEGFDERSRIAHVARERFRALAHKAFQSPRLAPYDAHLFAL